MKYGITTHYFSPFIKSDEQLYSEIKKAGYDCIDLSMYDKMFVVHPIFNESAQKWREFFKNKALSEIYLNSEFCTTTFSQFVR